MKKRLTAEITINYRLTGSSVHLNRNKTMRERVAEEAASLLYHGLEQEYKQAKLKAKKALKANFLPSNLEVALKLDRISAENEGPERIDRLIKMRQQALILMTILRAYRPILVGSVWRGTINHRSDIDIIVYHNYTEDILKVIDENNLMITKTERTKTAKEEMESSSFHIHIKLPTKEKVEIIVRNPEEIHHKNKCEIFGDTIKGFSIKELENILKKNPTQRFLPA